MTSMLSEPIDIYNCPPTGCVTQYYVDSATNRLNYLTGPNWAWAVSYSYDNAGNNTGSGRTFDAENRLRSMWGESYLYDGNSRRLRVKYGSTKTYYVYSATGLLLLDDNWTDGTVRNQIYFNGELVATHDQADYVRFVFKDYQGTIRNMAEVTPGGSDWTMNWSGFTEWPPQTLPYGYGLNGYLTSPATPNKYTGKPLSMGLSYFGARYYDGGSEGPSLRWISPDPITAHIYDPESPNKYSYVRNDPVNFIDPDGMAPIKITVEAPYWWEPGMYRIETDWDIKPTKAGDSRGGGGGRGPTIILGQPGPGINTKITAELRAWLIGTTIKALPNRIDDPDCNQWLQKVIDTLKKQEKPLLSNAISKPSDLINVALNNSQIYMYGGNTITALRNIRSGAFAQSEGSGIYLGEKFYQPSQYQGYNSRSDEVTTIIHELFQVGTASIDGRNLTDDVLGDLFGESSARTGLFGSWGNAVINHCGLKPQ
jgi:RHS repeat-associated protein